MQRPSSEVVRQSINFWPVSNTEINTDRLPDKESLATMEIRYRGVETGGGGDEVRVLQALAFIIVFGSLFTSLSLGAPEAVFRFWLKVESVEGLPVVAGLLLSMAAVIGVLSLVFVPGSIRTALASFSISVGLGVVARWIGHEFGAVVLLLCASVGAALVWRLVLKSFHESWLLADPRTDNRNLAEWRSRKERGWSLPSVTDAGGMLHRVLKYDQSLSGAAGVWAPPSSLRLRIGASAVLAGTVLILSALGADLLSGLGPLKAGLAVAASLATLVFVVGWGVGEAVWASREFEAMLGEDPRSAWQQSVDRLSNSGHISADKISGAAIYEAEHLFLGVEPWQKFPVLLHRPILHEHTYIVGRTGSGKTSMGLMQLLIQIVRGNRVSSEKWSEKSPLIIIDLKGDEVLFQTAKLEAEKRGQKFRFFTLEPGKASFRFNPFSGFRSETRTIPQLVQLVLDALSLYHGTGYGKGYYSQRSRFLLSEALRSAKEVNSFQDLYKTLRRLYGDEKQEFRDAFELLSVIESLTHYEQLVTTKLQDQDDSSDTIQLDRVLEEREVVYFWLPSAKESATVHEVGKLVLFNLQTAAQDRQAEGKKKRQAFLMIDECQKLAGENFQQILQQARSAGIAAVLANQSLSDLNTPDWDLRPTIRTNTRVKMYFSINEPEDLKTIQDFSGEEMQLYGLDDKESMRPRISAKELLALSDHPKRLLLHVSSGSGYTQFGGLPIPVETDWPISKSLADERAELPWPKYPVPPKAAENKMPSAEPQRKAINTSDAFSLQPPSAKKKPKHIPTKAARSPKVVPTPESKEAFAVKIQSLMDEGG